MADPMLTVDDLITGLIEQERWGNAHPHLRNYFRQRADALCELFHCDLQRRADELDLESEKNWAAFRRTYKNPLEDELDLSAYAVNGRDTISFLMSCIKLVNQTMTPWSYRLEGIPPQIERDLSKIYSATLESKVEELKELYRRIILDLLEFLFPSIGSKRFPEAKLFTIGLPRESPDPDDYF
jgi:hypothetical protein